jgi:transcriptional regulator with XRE-family HTH domain
MAINGKDLRVLRQIAGLTLDDMSKRCGVDRGTISRVERELQEPRRETIERIVSVIEEATS